MKPILSFLLLTLLSLSGSAQKDAEAKKILAQLSKRYRAIAVLKAEFTFSMEEPISNSKATQVGTLLSRPGANRFKVIIYESADRSAVAEEIISDGKNQWTYVKKNKEVELNELDHGGDNVNPAQLFTIYEHGYKYIYTGDQKVDGKTCELIDLTPEDAKKPFFKVRLAIDKISKLIYSATIFDKNGSRYTYVIRDFKANPKLPSNIFTFNKNDYPGVEVVDLR